MTIDAPSAAAGTYGASGAAFGPAPDEAGIAGNVVPVNDGSALPTEGCGPLVGFPAGAIALVDRGTCGFVQKVSNAQAAGATAVIIANNVSGVPGTMGGTDPTITIPAVMVSQADGATIKAGLLATGRVSSTPLPEIPDRSCHDTGAILGDAMKSVTIGHSAGFTWDGEVLIFGHEPGGGGQAQCQATSPLVNRTLFFFDADTGAPAGSFVDPRPQTSLENCTWHNYNVVPRTSDMSCLRQLPVRHQRGRLPDAGNAFEVAYADPAPLVNPDNPAAIELGDDWST